MKTLRLIPIVVSLLAASLLRAEPPLLKADPAQEHVSEERLQKLGAGLQRYVDESQHAGLVWLIARDGKIVDWRTAGFRDLDQKLLMERDTIFRAYSMSKIITSVAVLMLIEENRIGLDDSIGKYLPELSAPQVMTGGTADAPVLVPAKHPVTIHHLLTHTSGYIYDFDGSDAIHQLYQRADLWSPKSLSELMARVAKLPLAHQPGESFTYGINMDILGALVEKVSGKTFGQFLQERLFKPLHMVDTGFTVPAEKLPRLSKIYKHDSAGKLVEAQPMLNVWPQPGRSVESGGAGLFCTIGDYARFAQMLLNGGELDGQRYLSRKTVELMTQNHLANLARSTHGLGGLNGFGDAHGFGLGVEVRINLIGAAYPGSVGTFGWYGAATTMVQMDPKEHLIMLVFAQHFPFNEHHLFEGFQTMAYSALED